MNTSLGIGMTIGTQWVGYLSVHPHTRICKKIPISVPILSWATTLVPYLIPYGYLSAHTGTHYPHFNYEKTIKTSLLK